MKYFLCKWQKKFKVHLKFQTKKKLENDALNKQTETKQNTKQKYILYVGIIIKKNW